jgi:transposase
VNAEEALLRLEQLIALLEAARQKAGAVRVVVVYEAGQDGFWIARALQARGYEVLVVDPASIPVPRQARRAKTDRLDALMLLQCLLGWLAGESGRLHAVRVPSAQAEAQRHLARERGELIKEIGQHRDRIVKLLRTVGCWQPVESDFGTRLAAGRVRSHDGSALASQLGQRLQREWERMQLVQAQLSELERTLSGQLPACQRERIEQLTKLKAVGQVGATRLVLELFWRSFNNRRQVGSCLGLTPQPYDSGDSRVDQGISKQGNRRVRSLLVEMAWMWNRYQPQSEIAQWFARRTSAGAAGKRSKRIAIVAAARRLAIALWRYLEQGVVPPGAQFKTASH